MKLKCNVCGMEIELGSDRYTKGKILGTVDCEYCSYLPPRDNKIKEYFMEITRLDQVKVSVKVDVMKFPLGTVFVRGSLVFLRMYNGVVCLSSGSTWTSYVTGFNKLFWPDIELVDAELIIRRI